MEPVRLTLTKMLLGYIYLQNWTAESRWNVEEVVISGVDSTIGLFRSPEKHEIEKTEEVLEKLNSGYLKGRKFASLS